MNLSKTAFLAVIIILMFFLLIAFPAFSQETSEENSDFKAVPDGFFLIPVLETVFSKNVQWHPDWPAGFPPDAFLVQHENEVPAVICLDNENESFIVRRDSKGRLLEFPFFWTDSYAQVKAGYNETGALEKMELEQSDNTIMNILFPENFFPYSDLSLGGSFPVITVHSGDSLFFVFIFESPLFLTETWYDSEGKLLFYCKASAERENGRWRIWSYQIHDETGLRTIDYFFDSTGNITEICFEDRVYSSFFRNVRPDYWIRHGNRYDLYWDTRGLLTYKRVFNENGDLAAEYRYTYEHDEFGNWVKRSETVYSVQFNLLVPQQSMSAELEKEVFYGNWSRRIEYQSEYEEY